MSSERVIGLPYPEIFPARRPLLGEMLVRETVQEGLNLLRDEDPALHALLCREHQRQVETLSLVAASSAADPSVLICGGLALGNTTGEGYPGARFHAGCGIFDEVEQLAIERARAAFGAQYANVQPHSGTSANQIVMFSLLRPGDTVLGQELRAGGHLSHGAGASVSGRYFNAVGYGVGLDGRIDYDQVRALARTHRPRLIIAGASAYPRTIDFELFREIADETGAFLLADISHIAGLVVAGLHPSPVDHAHFTTTSTYKQLYGPRGGLILIGRDHDAPAPDGRTTLAGMIQYAAFPLVQGTPSPGAIAAKARALSRAMTPEFLELAERVVSGARIVAESLLGRGYEIVSGGTDNHVVLVDLTSRGMTGLVAERALEECNVLVNRNQIPGDRRKANVPSGIRLGTNTLALRGMGAREVASCAGLLDRCLSSLRVLGDEEYEMDPAHRSRFRAEVRELCRSFPLPRYSDAAEPNPVMGD